jgi:hypothetical protein
MEQRVIIGIFLILSVLSCKKIEPTKQDEVVTATLNSIYVNYFVNDSLQAIQGYYPASAYLEIKISNSTENTLFIPFKTSFDTITYSEFKVRYDTKIIVSRTYLYKSSEYKILPQDTLWAIIKVDIPLEKEFRRDSIFEFINGIDVLYCFDKRDIPLLKGKIIDNLPIKKGSQFKIYFREEESLDDMIEWI